MWSCRSCVLSRWLRKRCELICCRVAFLFFDVCVCDLAILFGAFCPRATCIAVFFLDAICWCFPCHTCNVCTFIYAVANSYAAHYHLLYYLCVYCVFYVLVCCVMLCFVVTKYCELHLLIILLGRHIQAHLLIANYYTLACQFETGVYYARVLLLPGSKRC